MQSRFAITSFFLLSSILSGLYLAYSLNTDRSLSSWAGAMFGGILGVLLCYFILNPGKAKAAEDREIVNVESDSRWMIVVSVGGILLAKIVSTVFSPQLQNAINQSVSAWIVIVFGWIGILAWRYMPRG